MAPRMSRKERDRLKMIEPLAAERLTQAETLAERDAVAGGREWLRRGMIEAGLWRPRRGSSGGVPVTRTLIPLIRAARRGSEAP